MRRILVLLAALLAASCASEPSAAQTTRVTTSCTGINMNWAVNDLGRPLMVDQTGVLCTNAAGGGGGGAGTEYVEDAVAPANPTAPALMLRRKDTLSASEVSADGDWVGWNGTSRGQAHTYDLDLNTVIGTTADAAVTAGAAGSNAAKLRAISRDVMTVNTWGGVALGAPSAYGTSPGAVNVPGVNAFVTNTLPSGMALPANSSPVVAALPTLAGNATFVSGTTAAMTGTTSTQIIPLVTSNRIYVTRIACKGDPTNAVATKVQIRDGAAGTVLDTLTVAANGGGEQGTGPTPLFWTTAGTALYAQNVTTASSVICTASGYSG